MNSVYSELSTVDGTNLTVDGITVPLTVEQIPSTVCYTADGLTSFAQMPLAVIMHIPRHYRALGLVEQLLLFLLLWV